jgi:hypothetical protein
MSMIADVIEQWHRYLRGEFPDGLDELLADDVIFYSPVVYTPQAGKEITKLYLQAAAVAFAGSGGGEVGSAAADGSGFRYTKQVLAGDTAVLEFETTIEGKYINGVDIIRVDAQGKIVEFRVMIRPLQAVNAVHAQMRSMLERLGGTRPGATGANPTGEAGK